MRSIRVDRRFECCILCLFHIQEESENGSAQFLTNLVVNKVEYIKLFNDAETELVFFTLKRNIRVKTHKANSIFTELYDMNVTKKDFDK